MGLLENQLEEKLDPELWIGEYHEKVDVIYRKFGKPEPDASQLKSLYIVFEKFRRKEEFMILVREILKLQKMMVEDSEGPSFSFKMPKDYDLQEARINVIVDFLGQTSTHIFAVNHKEHEGLDYHGMDFIMYRHISQILKDRVCRTVDSETVRQCLPADQDVQTVLFWVKYPNGKDVIDRLQRTLKREFVERADSIYDRIAGNFYPEEAAKMIEVFIKKYNLTREQLEQAFMNAAVCRVHES